MVDYVDTGLSANSVPYLTALEQQRAMHAAVASGRASDTVILLEHPSVYTAGKRTEPHERSTDGTLRCPSSTSACSSRAKDRSTR